MKAREAMIAWMPSWHHRKETLGSDKPVLVCRHPDESMVSNHLPLWNSFRCVEEEMLKPKIFIEAWHIACRDGVPLSDLHSELMKIDEYRDGLSPDFQVTLTKG